MTTDNRFMHKAVITSHRLYNSDEGCINLNVYTPQRKLDLTCFVHSETSAQLYRDHFKDDDEVIVSFDFLTANFNSRGMPLTFIVSDVKKKSVQKNRERAGNSLGCNSSYLVEGKIIKLSQPGDPELAKVNDYAMLDCGIYLCADIPKAANLKVGDYIRVQGRLDAHILGRVGGGSRK